MKSKIIERISCGIHYEVDPTTQSDIYLDQETIDLIVESGHELSVSGVSSYLRALLPSFSPVLLIWDMTSRCNFDCVFCYIRDNSIADEIDFKTSKDTLDFLISEGLFEVYLSGGECLILDDFIEIYTYLKRKGVFVTVFTNGALIDDELLQCWRDLPPSSVEITLYSNDFSSKPFHNILRLLTMGLHVVVKFTLTKSTIDYFDDVKNWAFENDIELVVDSELFNGNDIKHKNIEEIYSISKEQKKLLNPSRYEDVKAAKVIRTGFPCKSKQGIVQISPDFSLSLCHKMKTRWDLKKVDVRSAIFELQRLIDTYQNAILHGCEGCVYSKMCDMCFASAININENLYVPDGYCNKVKEKFMQY